MAAALGAELKIQAQATRPWHHDIESLTPSSTGQVFPPDEELERDVKPGVSSSLPWLAFLNQVESNYPHRRSGKRFPDCSNIGGSVVSYLAFGLPNESLDVVIVRFSSNCQACSIKWIRRSNEFARMSHHGLERQAQVRIYAESGFCENIDSSRRENFPVGNNDWMHQDKNGEPSFAVPASLISPPLPDTTPNIR